MTGVIKQYSPDSLYSILKSSYTTIHPKKTSRIIYPVDGCWRVITKNDNYYTFKNQMSRGSEKWQKEKYDRYNCEGFCTVEYNDIVVDVGAFVGEFSIPVSFSAQKVICIEPDPDTFKTLVSQTRAKSNILAINVLPHNESKKIEFNKAMDGSESSLIDVDEGDYEVIQMEAKELDIILSNHGINHIDFLKMDAEGAEPEVLEGIDETYVDKFAIDVGEERGGDDTEDDVKAILRERGYDCRVVKDKKGDPILFAKNV